MERFDRKRLLGQVLRDVSRSFYLTIRVLPQGLREPIGLAYLLARAADTIADTRGLPRSTRLEHLLSFRQQVRGPADVTVLESIAADVSEESSTAAERALLVSLPDAFTLLEGIVEEDRERVRSVVLTLTSGMQTDLTTFPAEDSGQVAALASADELDRYIYLVAGCVGEFWTGVTAAHEPRLDGWDLAGMSATGVRFGKALQLTNVLRDVPGDLRNGRCYLPADELAAAGLAAEDLLDPDCGPRARTVLVPWIETALAHFDAAEHYLIAVPRRCVRLRLAVLWPILLGLATLYVLARNKEWLDPARLSKVNRKWVYLMMARSWPAVTSDTVLRSWIRGLRRRVQSEL
jgi:farnesyl-diphosphate farnesyltransferase